MKWYLLPLLAGCASNTAASAPTHANPGATDTADILADYWVDADEVPHDRTYGAARIEQAVADIERLPPAEQQRLADAGREMMTNSPNTRTQILAAHVLDRELSAIEPSALPADAQPLLLALQRSVRAEVALAKALNLNPHQEPMADDYLSVGFASLTQPASPADDPTAPIHALLADIDTVASHKPAAIDDRIQQAWRVLEPIMVPLGGAMLAPNNREEQLKNLLDATSAHPLSPTLERLHRMMAAVGELDC